MNSISEKGVPMPISMDQVKERLERYSTIEDLKDKDKQRIYSILKSIGQKHTGTRVSDIKRKSLGMSNTHLIPSFYWLKKCGYLEDWKGYSLILSDKGRKALQILDDYFLAPLENPRLRIKLKLEEEKEVVANITGDPDNITRTAILSNSFIRDRILELSAALCSSLGKVSLSIDLSPANEGEVVVLLKVLWSFYWQTLRERRPNLLGPLYIDMNLTYDDDKKAYTEFWKKHLEKVLQYAGKKTHFEIYTTLPSGERKIARSGEKELVPLLPQPIETLPIFVKHEKIKRWIESQLEKDADWFMPHCFWVKLGFKRRREDLSVNSIDHVSPPLFHEITSPKLPREYAHFDSMIRYVVRKEDEESVKALCMWIISGSDWRNQGFYESWRILRREHKEKIGEEPKFRDIAKILDAALLEYIIADHNPNVDLHSVLNDYLVSQDVGRVVGEIKVGKYRGIHPRKRRGTTRLSVGNLYRRREKAWHRFLKKYYPNLEKPFKDGKLLKKILVEFKEYWKEEYWDEDVGTDKN